MHSDNTNIRTITPRQWAVYVLSLIILALGICLNTKTLLGVSPIISIPYSIARLTNLPLGVMTFIYYCLLILLQKLMLGKKFDSFQYLQIVASIITSLFIQVFDIIFPDCTGMAGRLIVLILAIVITGIGASLSVSMKIVPNPADGLAKTVGQLLHKDVGFGKNLIDLISIVISFSIGLVAVHGLLGVGIGTVVSMILTGRVMHFFAPVSNAIYEKVRHR